MKRNQLFFIMLLINVYLSCFVFSDDIFDRFLKTMQGLKTLKANFSQVEVTLTGTEKAEGILWLKRPYKMKWEYATPEHKIFYLYRDHYEFFLPEEKQMIYQLLEKEDIDNSPLTFFVQGCRKLKDFYEIQKDSSLVNSFSYILTSKRDDATFPKVLIKLGGKLLFIKNMTLFESDGSTHKFSFWNIKLNIPIKNSIFKFIPPKDIEIIHQD